MKALRGGLNERRTALVDQAFNKFDRDGSGVIDLDDLRGIYDASRHPKVLSGVMKASDVLADFLKTFDGSSNPDGAVTREEFQAYYAGVSAGIDDDEVFDLMMNNVWQLHVPQFSPSVRSSRPASKKITFKADTSPSSSSQSFSPFNSRGPSKTQATRSALPPINLDGTRAAKSAPTEAPRRIKGYTGHIPFAQVTYGKNWAFVEKQAPYNQKVFYKDGVEADWSAQARAVVKDPDEEYETVQRSRHPKKAAALY